MPPPKQFPKTRMIRVTDEQAAWLEEEAARRGITPAELVRRCIDSQRLEPPPG